MNFIKLYRIIALLEGVSLLVILGITMPLKYIFDMPQYNMVIGMAHGVLFIAYVILAAMAHVKLKWKYNQLLLALVASIIPFGTFYADKKLFKNA